MGFYIFIKVVQLLNFQQQVPKVATSTCKLTKLKLTTNPQLTYTQITQSLKKVG